MDVYVNTKEDFEKERRAYEEADHVRVSVGVDATETEVIAVAKDGTETAIRFIKRICVTSPPASLLVTWIDWGE